MRMIAMRIPSTVIAPQARQKEASASCTVTEARSPQLPHVTESGCRGSRKLRHACGQVRRQEGITALIWVGARSACVCGRPDA
jgi:hypothetical protein